ncbi:MAG: PAS domain-containing protein [Myxococcota bacterium]|nr:PAS domain-containing protein [Myxococcota bacterium]
MKKGSNTNGERARPRGELLPAAPTRAKKSVRPPADVGQVTPGQVTPGQVTPGQVTAEAEAPLEPSRGPARPFPVVGIGASAGGLEALERFLTHVPENSGMAFVVVQHLDPSRKGMLVELLQRKTRMKVIQAKDDLSVEPEHVYVIPPNRDLAIVRGALVLLPQALRRGVNLPIDFFFRSLAEDQQEKSVGVILSGMGSDGVLGLRALKERGAATFVQSIESAKFDGMPRSAIDSGLADVVAPVEEIPERILAYKQHARSSVPPPARAEKTGSALEKVFTLLRVQTGNDFSLYKESTIVRRIERRMGLHQIDSLDHYVRYLRENPREIELLFRELLIGVTCFFRDPAAWQFLASNAFPALFAAHPDGAALRAWVDGCSTGEEAYSLAMVFKEVVGSLSPARKLSLQIFATDLDRDAIERARIGLYPDNIAADVSADRLDRFFVKDDRGYRICKEIRQMVVFAPQNIIMDPPFTKLDFLSCRNLLIYLSSGLQKKLIPMFHYALNAGGLLFLGSAETIGTFSGLFAPLEPKARVYRKIDQPSVASALSFPPVLSVREHGDAIEADGGTGLSVIPSLQVLAERVIIHRFAPASVLCSEKGDILYITGRVGKYLEPASGRPVMNVFVMARDGLRTELSNAFAAAVKGKGPINVRNLRVKSNGDVHKVDLSVQRLDEPRELRGTVIVVLSEATAVPGYAPPRNMRRISDGGRMKELESELGQSREEIQTIREEMQTSQEELKSTNEELQSTNEELQSTNEELTTSKEEMQSLNEELQTVNHELQSKVDELSRSNNDMKNLLNSTDIATLFLDSELRVRRFTTPTARIIKLLPIDIGRPITDIVSELDYPDLASDAREVLRTLAFRERQTSTRNGRWFTVRILPYRTLDNVIDGVVIIFTDASDKHALELALRQAEARCASLLEKICDGVIELDREHVVVSANPAAERLLGRRGAELSGKKLGEALPELCDGLGAKLEQAASSRLAISVEIGSRVGKDGCVAVVLPPAGDRTAILLQSIGGGEP